MIWKIIGLTLIVSLIIFTEVPLLVRKKGIKELCAFSVLLLVGVVLNIVLIFEVNITSPLEVLIIIYKPISDYVQALLN
ncbi:hypothetical protein [Aquibacillus kalidii]|uniref:hypothetical protein n=1 Tax=Aquibacillus kalidii TaxID=2762597 RepID=UPI00164652D7|nr:hypothetical protein [Aquibacillus kalidii]